MFNWFPHPIYTTDGSTNYFYELIERLADFGSNFAVGSEIIAKMFFTPMVELAEQYPVLRVQAFVFNLLGIANLNMIEFMFLFGFGTYVSFTLMKYLLDLIT